MRTRVLRIAATAGAVLIGATLAAGAAGAVQVRTYDVDAPRTTPEQRLSYRLDEAGGFDRAVLAPAGRVWTTTVALPPVGLGNFGRHAVP